MVLSSYSFKLVLSWVVLSCVGWLHRNFHGVVFLLFQASFTPHFVEIGVKIKASGSPQVLKVVGDKQGHAPRKNIYIKGTLPVKYIYIKGTLPVKYIYIKGTLPVKYIYIKGMLPVKNIYIARARSP